MTSKEKQGKIQDTNNQLQTICRLGGNKSKNSPNHYHNHQNKVTKTQTIIGTKTQVVAKSLGPPKDIKSPGHIRSLI